MSPEESSSLHPDIPHIYLVVSRVGALFLPCVEYGQEMQNEFIRQDNYEPFILKCISADDSGILYSGVMSMRPKPKRK